jgi:tol-pal system protein YbgF
MFKKITYFAVVAGVGLTTFAASAQNINSLQIRLDRMEREMQTLSRSVYKGDVPPPQIQSGVDSQAMAQSEVRMSQLEDQLRRLTGMIEENSYRTRQLEDKIKNLSSAPSVSQAPVATSPATVDTSSLVVDNTPYQLGTITNNNKTTTPAGLYDQAFSYLQVNDYANAQGTFESFIEKYPDHSLAANSKYWLGETFYAREDYSSASRAFARSFKDHPEGQKAPDTLLKLAMSLKSQDMKNEACLTLGELKSRFPNAPASVLSKANSERQAYQCP